MATWEHAYGGLVELQVSGGGTCGGRQHMKAQFQDWWFDGGVYVSELDFLNEKDRTVHGRS